MADWRVLGVARAGSDRTNDNLASVHTDARFEWQVAGLAQPSRVTLQLFLQAQRGVQCALRMVLVRNRRAEQCEDAVAGRLHDVTVVALHRVDHQLEGGINNCARLFGIEVLLELGRALDVGKQRGDRLALSVCRGRSVRVFRRDANTTARPGRHRNVRANRGLPIEYGGTLRAEFRIRRVQTSAFWTRPTEWRRALIAESGVCGIVDAALRAMHFATDLPRSRWPSIATGRNN